ncbi:MAG: YdcF family protein [Lachnospiraceae bacterium]|nr:YdcF family protein [Lachnospiraceae bacterium]
MNELNINNIVSTNIPIFITGIVAVLMITAIILVCVMLKRKLKTKFYSYTNIALFALLIFITVFLAVDLLYLYSFLFTGPYMTVKELLFMYIEFPKKFSLFAVSIVVVICFGIFISNIFLIKYEGFRLYNLLGAILGICFVVAFILTEILDYSLDYVNSTYISVQSENVFGLIKTSVSIFFLTMLCYFECIYFGTIIMSYLAAKKVPSYDKDYIIILGCSIDKRGSLRPLLKARTNRAVRFAWEQEIATGKSVKFVPSGGQGSDERMSEASAMELYLLSHSVEEYEIYPEKKSRNTIENFKYSLEIIQGLNKDAKVAFATTNYHVLRSGIIARYAGLDAEGIASKTKWYFWPNGFVREFTAIILMKLKVHIKIAVIILMISISLGFLRYIL